MAFPTTGVLDTFDRANGPVGAAWTTPVWNEVGGMRVDTNRVSFPDGDNGGYWNAQQFGPDSEAYVDVTTSAGTVQLYFRFDPTGASADGYGCSFRKSDNAVNVLRFDNGSDTQLGASITQSVADGDSIGAEMVTDVITPYHKTGGTWSALSTRTDATYTGDGFIGLRGFNATWRGDNYGGGTRVGPDTGLAWITA